MLRKFIEIIRLIVALFFLLLTIGFWQGGGSTIAGTVFIIMGYLIAPRGRLKEIDKKENGELDGEEKFLLFIRIIAALFFSLMVIGALESFKLFLALLIVFIVYFIFPINFFLKRLEANSDLKADDEIEDIVVDIEEDIKYMKEMHNKIQSTVRTSVELLKEAEDKEQEAKKKMNYCQKRAKSALEDNNEAEAREVLRHKKRFEKLYHEYREQVEHRKASLDSHLLKLDELSREIEEAENMRDELIAEKENANITTEINTTLADIEEINDENLKIVEERIGKLKIKAEASNEFYNNVEKNDLEEKFEELEDNQTLNEELLKLKEEISEGSQL
ncbi:phage shock protein A (PspA) family protein [Orenia metallireducens]|uniref:Phage shock protein A (PspA) family protein n=1 Tax=Orenia metallireducens TaxID=1413210 RepID=A0A285HGW5_9FIRM|nr:PspA/IM30 family protein [Orenia metallireducens]PRX27156.1 phage shock protein A (PspA) family protein [Orenia metallireducens]SNY34999.1 phage shock protein A (PspA) family protein [Orenia metallireducens]